MKKLSIDKIGSYINELKSFSLFLAIFFFIYIGLRHKTGPDFFIYLDRFTKIDDKGYDYILFNYISKTLIDFNLNQQLLFVLYAFFTIFPLILFSREVFKSRENRGGLLILSLSIMLLPGMNIMRQAAAISLCLYALSLFLNKKYLLFIIVLIAATLFHKTAFIFFAVCPLCLIKISYNKAIKHFIFLSLIACTFLNTYPIIEKILVESNFFSTYLSRSHYTNAAPMMTKVIIATKIILLYLLSYLIDKKKLIFFESKYNKNLFQLISNSLIIIAFFLALSSSMMNLGRMYLYLKPLIALALIIVIRFYIKNTKYFKFTIYGLSLMFIAFSYIGAAKKESAFRHYTINTCLSGEACPQTLWGDLSKAKKWQKKPRISNNW